MRQTCSSRWHSQMDPQWLQYVGDCGAPAKFLANRSARSAWLPVLAVDALLRSFGQVILANNPLTGLVYFAGMTVVRPWAGFGAFLCGVICLITATLSRQPRAAISAGQAVTNAAMLGFVTMVILQESPSVRACLLLAGASVISCYVTSAVSSFVNALVHSRPSTAPCKTDSPWPPVFALPFGLLQPLILVLLPDFKTGYHLGESTYNVSQLSNSTFDVPQISNLAVNLSVTGGPLFNTSDFHISWGLFLEEIISAPAQVLALHSIIAGATGWAAILVYSPTAAGCAFLGALEAAILGMALGVYTQSPADVVTAFGQTAANGLLTFMAVASHSFVPSCGANMAGVAAAALAGAVHAACRLPILRTGLPILLLPYSVVSILFLLLAHLVRPSVISFPEKQRFDHVGRFGCGSSDDDSDTGSEGVASKPNPSPVRLVTSSL